MTNQSGSLVETTQYDPWGKINVGGTASKFLYTGQEHDSESGLHYYNARYYNPDIRRFTQPDDIIQDVYDPQSLNRYSYVRNNPLRYTDPTGHCWGKFLGGLCGKISNAFKSAFSNKPAPKPASTAKLPDNKAFNNAPINLSNKSGNLPTTYARETAITNFVSDVRNSGHADISVSTGRRGVLGGGTKIDKQGTTQYITGGAGREVIKGYRVGATALLSTNPVKQNSVNYNFTASFGVAAQFNIDSQEPYNINKWKLEGLGVGCCGADIAAEYTGKTYPHYNLGEEVNFRSKELEEFYGK